MTRANGHDSEHANGADKAIDGEAYASVGAWLAARRRALGSTLEAVEAATRVRQDYLEAIEDMDPRRMPTGPYAPGFVRTYALHLGLDPEEVGGRFAKELSPRRARAPRLENAEGFSGFSIGPRAWGAIGASVVLIGLIGYGLRPRAEDGFNVVPPVPEGLEEWAQAEVATRVSSAAQELVGGPELALHARVPAYVEARTQGGDTFIARTLEGDETWVVPRVPGVM
ncbi:MAG: helix-turn-helix transcriptional regulator, partial [Maricaulaceae bacterium]